jgi:hypothetical protein
MKYSDKFEENRNAEGVGGGENTVKFFFTT